MAATLTLTLIVFFEAIPLEQQAPSRIFVGFSIGAIGIFLRSWAICLLGDRFRDSVDLAPSHTIARHGPYRFSHIKWFRHPGEIGFLLGMGGLCIIGDGPIATIWLVAIVLPLSIARMLLEDRLLSRSLSFQS